MKRVRYAIGAAGLLPAAIGGMAHAETLPSAASATKAKTVSTYFAATRVGSGSCKGTNSVGYHVNSLIQGLTIFYATTSFGAICIGTMEARRHFLNHNCVTITFTVAYGGSGTNASSSSIRRLTNRCGNAGSTKTFESGFRHSYPPYYKTDYVSACVSSTYTTKPYCAKIHVS